MGRCKDGINCNFCHEVHATKEANLDKSQRNIIRSLSSHQSAALILDLVKFKLSKMDIQGGEELVSSLEYEASTQQVLMGLISTSELLRLRKTLSRMNLRSLLALFTSRSIPYCEEDRVRVERVFSLAQTIRNQLALPK
eukprot:Skav209227  [mRNA]  locus=scaffold293:101486:102768:- [translate_table: standard]